jgi:hypothetical protein
MPATEPSDLYGLPLERFTDERNALAKRLRQDGRREEGAEVAKLRKPSVAAWAVNQLVRTQKRDVDTLLAAGDALQKAQDDVLGGRADAGALRRAADAERAALEALTAAARGLLSSEGHELAPAKLEQVSETLHAAAIDEQARAQVRDATLVRELRHVGLGPPGAIPGPARTRRRSQPGDSGRAQAEARAEARAQAEARAAARQAVAAARRRRERAERAVRAATERRDRAAEQLRDAEEQLDRARRALDEL